jgi:hypothetical protein
MGVIQSVVTILECFSLASGLSKDNNRREVSLPSPRLDSSFCMWCEIPNDHRNLTAKEPCGYSRERSDARLASAVQRREPLRSPFIHCSVIRIIPLTYAALSIELQVSNYGIA